MYIDDFEDFYRADESEFPEDFDSRDEEDNFEEFQEFTEFKTSRDDLDDFIEDTVDNFDDDIFRGFDDTDEINDTNTFNNNSFICPAGCPFYRQFYRQMPPPGYGGSRQMDRPPSGPPPSSTPAEPFSAAGGPQTFVDAGSIRGCLFRFVYIWPRRGRSFWMWPVYVGRRSIAGWRWDGRRWFYFGMDLRDIRSFRC